MMPIVHLNGTAREELLAQYLASGKALQLALEAMEQASPNARDYYPAGPDAYRVAINRWVVLCEHVREALEECQATAEHIDEQAE